MGIIWLCGGQVFPTGASHKWFLHFRTTLATHHLFVATIRFILYTFRSYRIKVYVVFWVFSSSLDPLYFFLEFLSSFFPSLLGEDEGGGGVEWGYGLTYFSGSHKGKRWAASMYVCVCVQSFIFVWCLFYCVAFVLCVCGKMISHLLIYKVLYNVCFTFFLVIEKYKKFSSYICITWLTDSENDGFSFDLILLVVCCNTDTLFQCRALSILAPSLYFCMYLFFLIIHFTFFLTKL